MSNVYGSSPFEGPGETISRVSHFSKQSGLSSGIVFVSPVYSLLAFAISPARYATPKATPYSLNFE